MICLFKNSKTILNFSYVPGSEDFGNNLINFCEENNVKKLIHISTCEVFGKKKGLYLNEKDYCLPYTKYQKDKKKVEDILLNNSKKTRVCILRPTVVFGNGSKNLLKLINEVKYKSYIYNFLKLSLFKKRRLNLLSVNYLSEVIRFMISKNLDKDEIFLVSQCENENNNFYFVFKEIERLLNKKNKIKPISLNLFFIKFLLYILNKQKIKLDTIFDNSKLIKYGFKTKVKFEKDLNQYLNNVI